MAWRLAAQHAHVQHFREVVRSGKPTECLRLFVVHQTVLVRIGYQRTPYSNTQEVVWAAGWDARCIFIGD